jgi:hypothetical protein
MKEAIENPFDEQGREWFIPPCANEIRVASDWERVIRNPDFRTRTDRDFKCISYGQGPDGDMIVNCIGDGEECQGGEVIVDRHDILQDRMPLTTAALRGICEARRMYYSEHGFVRPHEVTD